jgi:carboxylesterase
MQRIHADDFCYMWQGKIQGTLVPEAVDRIKPFHITRTGNERALLMLHGFSSTPAQFRLITPELSEYDALVGPALPGHATNLQDFAQVSADKWYKYVEGLCQELMQQYRMVDIIGLSLGGLLACHLATLFPVHRLFLLAPALHLAPRLRRLLPFAPWLAALGLRHVRNRAGSLRTPAHNELGYRWLPSHSIIEVYNMISNFHFTAPTCPIDLFLGSYDNVVDTKTLATQFAPLANTRVHWLNNSSHLLTLDNDVEQIITCLNES